jgi:hypothetical protein
MGRTPSDSRPDQSIDPRKLGLNLIQKLDDPLKKFTDSIEYTTCKSCPDMAGKPEVGWCQVKAV